ncbi:type IV-A pilus assembly ATPase PilB [bacterium]|nr:type IV-A pilus assembly ATPase PilB [bacterium]
MKRKLGTILIEKGLITNQQLEEALIKQQSAIGVPLGRILFKMGFVDENNILQCLAEQYGLEAVRIEDIINFESLGKPFLEKINFDIARKYFIMPVSRMGSVVSIAMSNPGDLFALEDIRFIAGLQIKPVIATETDIKNAWRKYYLKKGDPEEHESKKMEISSKDYEISDDDFAGPDMDSDDDMGVVNVEEFDDLITGAIEEMTVVDGSNDPDDDISGEDAPIVKLVNGILVRAIKSGVSDIHIEPYEKAFYVRFRVDGVLHKVMSLPLKVKNAIVSRIKIMSRLDIAERRLPQSGRIKLKVTKKKAVDFRVEVLPCLFGERVVMRIMSTSAIQTDLTKSGFLQQDLDKFMKAINAPWGMILITGPTGSGKTSTLYSALNLLNTPDVNILTAEDPVELNFQGISQVQVIEKIGLTFAASLRSFLRMDPDIVMVGEVRDSDTAEICVKAALTGHLVLSTVHTNDAPSTIGRLVDMGIKPYLLASALNIIVAQRLCRKICPNCKIEDTTRNPAEFQSMGFMKDEIPTLKVYKGEGCSKCMGSGNSGRIGLFEVLAINEALRREISKDAELDVLRKLAAQSGMRTLREVGLQKVRDGICSIDEVLKTTMAE